MSEISLVSFFCSEILSVEVDINLKGESQADVDLQLEFDSAESIFLEVQWISPSNRSDKAAIIATKYGEVGSIDFEYEAYRAKLKVRDKVRKLTKEHVTLVALDCTTTPELLGIGYEGLLYSQFRKTFTSLNADGSQYEFADDPIDQMIREYVDGILWFSILPGTYLMPSNRGICMNVASPHARSGSIPNLKSIWLPPQE